MLKISSIHISSKETLGEYQATGSELLTQIYKQQIGGYPKFYKMDPLAKLGFVASELLLILEQELASSRQEQIIPRFTEREDRAIVLVNHSASIAADDIYAKTIQTGDDYFPSPADFVYTLPNIVTGEIAIRNHYYGESNFLCVQDISQTEDIIRMAFADPMTTSVIGGWLECTSPNDFEAELSIYVK